MIGFRGKASGSEIGEVINQESGWGARLDYPARQKVFATTRAVDLSVPERGEGYDWDMDGGQGHDDTVALLFGRRASVNTVLNYDSWKPGLAIPMGARAVHFALTVFEKPTIITRDDLEGIKRVEALFERLGYAPIEEPASSGFESIGATRTYP